MEKSFKIHEIPGYICNLFLAEYDDGILLLDSGSIADVKRIENYCQNVLKRPVSDIKLVVVSHSHPDHAGGASVWRNKHKIPIAAHPRIDKWYHGAGGLLQHKIDCYLASWVAYRKKIKLEPILFNPRIRPDHVLEDQAELPYFPDWQVLHIPGHTINDVALYNEEEKTLYPGDCVMDVAGKLLLPVPIVFPDKMADSFDRLAELDANTIVLAHGSTIITDDPAEVFLHMKTLLEKPHNPLTALAYKLSYFSPEYRRYKGDKRGKLKAESGKGKVESGKGKGVRG